MHYHIKTLQKASQRGLFFVLIILSSNLCASRDPDDWTEEERISAIRSQALDMSLSELQDASGNELDEKQLVAGVLDLSYIPIKKAYNLLKRFNVLAFITHLYLDGLGLTRLPDCLIEMKNLIHLSLKHNKLRRFPELLPPQLEVLDLSYNHFSRSHQLDYQSYDKLRKLDLSHNKITFMSLYLPSIETLVLSHNELEAIALGNCVRKLEWLDLSSNSSRLESSLVIAHLKKNDMRLYYLDMQRPKDHFTKTKVMLGDYNYVAIEGDFDFKYPATQFLHGIPKTLF